jgi:hypothetical protein
MTTLLDDLRTLAMVDYGRVRGLSLHLDRLDRDAREMFGRGFDASVAEHEPEPLVTPAAPARVCTVEYERDLFVDRHARSASRPCASPTAARRPTR